MKTVHNHKGYDINSDIDLLGYQSYFIHHKDFDGCVFDTIGEAKEEIDGRLNNDIR